MRCALFLRRMRRRRGNRQDQERNPGRLVTANEDEKDRRKVGGARAAIGEAG